MRLLKVFSILAAAIVTIGCEDPVSSNRDSSGTTEPVGTSRSIDILPARACTLDYRMVMKTRQTGEMTITLMGMSETVPIDTVMDISIPTQKIVGAPIDTILGGTRRTLIPHYETTPPNDLIEDTIKATSYYEVRDDGVYLVAGSLDTTFEILAEPMLMYKTPLIVGDRWEVGLDPVNGLLGDGSTSTQSTVMHVVGMDDVAWGGGVRKALRIDGATSGTKTMSEEGIEMVSSVATTAKLYFIADTGLVKSVTDGYIDASLTYGSADYSFRTNTRTTYTEMTTTLTRAAFPQGQMKTRVDGALTGVTAHARRLSAEYLIARYARKTAMDRLRKN